MAGWASGTQIESVQVDGASGAGPKAKHLAHTPADRYITATKGHVASFEEKLRALASRRDEL